MTALSGLSDIVSEDAHSPAAGGARTVLVVPDAQLLFSADFKRSGPDLILTAPDGDRFTVLDYFRHKKLPDLVTPDGATFGAKIIEALTGTGPSYQYAQATAPAPAAQVIGKVEKITGSATAIRNGVAVTLNVGDALNKADIIQTGSDSTCGISLLDGTALNLSANTRMALNEFLFDANATTGNGGHFSLVQGAFAFVSGLVANTGGLSIETPVAVIGIRGTVGGASCAAAGRCDFYAAPEIAGDKAGQASTFTLLAGGRFENGLYVGGTPVGTVTVGAVATVTAAGVGTQPQVTFTPAAAADPGLAALTQQLIQFYPQVFVPTPAPQQQQPKTAPSPGSPAPDPTPLLKNDNPTDLHPLAATPPPTEMVVTIPPPPTIQNQSTPTVVVAVTFQSPLPPVVNGPSISSVTSVTGPVVNGGKTNDSNPTVTVNVSGTGAVAGDTVQLYNGSSPLGGAQTLTASDITNGFANVQIGALSDGTTYNINARITNSAGNQSDPSPTFTVIEDTTAPTAPTITLVIDNIDPVPVALANGANTSDPDLTVRVSVSGSGAVAGDTIQLYNGNSPLGTLYVLTTDDIAHGFADVQTGTLTDGTTYDITARITDAARNQSTSSATFTVTELSTVPVVSDISVADGILKDAGTTVSSGNLFTGGPAAGNLVSDIKGSGDANAVAVTAGGVVAQGTLGNLTVMLDGTYSYQANQNFDALKPGDQTSDVFSVTISIGGSAVTLDLTFHITGANDLPVVVNPIPNQIINEDVGWVFTIPANTFSDPEGSSLTFAAALAGGAPLPNWLSFNSTTGTFSGTPPLNANGSVPLEVVASDGTASVANLFTLNVLPVNDSPVVVNGDHASLTTINENNVNPGGATLAELLTGHFSDAADEVPGGSHANTLAGVAIYSNPADPAGVWEWSSDGTTWHLIATDLSDSNALVLDASTKVRFVPSTGFNGDAPALLGRVIDDSSGSVTSGTSVNLAVSGVGGSTPYSAGSVIIDEIVNVAPTTTPVTLAAIAEDSGPRLITQGELLANASDIDGPSLTAVDLQVSSGGGSLDDNGNGTWTYHPALNDDTSVAFSYSVTDGVAPVATTASLDITPANDAPVVAHAIADQNATQGIQFTFSFAANTFSDVDGDPLLYTASLDTDQTLPAWLHFDGNTRTFSGTPTNADVGTIAVKVTATDGSNASVSDIFNMVVGNTNDAPVIQGVGGTVPVAEDGSILLQALSAQVTDADGDTLTMTLGVSGGRLTPSQAILDAIAAGTLTGLDVDGLDGSLQVRGSSAAITAAIQAGITYAPNANVNGLDALDVAITDGQATTNASVAINITQVNDAPGGTDNSVTTLEDTARTLAAIDFGFSDPNDSPANTLQAVTITTLPGAGTLTNNGTLVTGGQSVSVADINAGLLKFTPAPNANGNGYASFTFQVQDNGGTANGGLDLDQTPNTITINVTPVDDAAVAITAIATDSGTAGDFITNDTTLIVSGTNGALGAGEKVQISSDGSNWFDVTQTTGTTWNFNDAGNPHLSNVTYQVRVIDAAANVGSTASQLVIIDTAPPAAGTLSFANLTDSGTPNTPPVTQDNAFDLALAGQETAAGTTTVYQVSVNGGGFANTTASQGALADGSYQFRAVTTDAAGNASTSNVIAVVVDNSAPVAVATVTGLSADTGTVGDFITSVASQTVSGSYTGTLLAGEKIQVSTDGNIWIDATAAAGLWSASGVTLVAGTGTLSVRTIDAADNTTPGTGHSYTLTITGDNNDNVLIGTSGIDWIEGLGGHDTLQGLAGNDLLDGGSGLDRAIYTDATGPITIDLAAGTAHGTAPGDLANVGTDTLVSIEQIRGSNFADSYVATGYTGVSPIGSFQANANEFEGMAGNDVITGNGATQLSYLNATAGVTVNFTSWVAEQGASGTATGDASVGSDTFTGVQVVRGSEFNDTFHGSDNPTAPEVFQGRGGDDLIDGGGGFDRASYWLRTDDNVTGGITVNMAAGTVVGDASVGQDTLLSVEAVRGTNFADTYNATGFTASSTNAGSAGVNNVGAAFNEFEGLGGNDSITGNGNTRISYINATDAVTVDIATGTAHSIVGDLANVGSDTFAGVNAVQGSYFGDTLSGSNNAANTTEFFDGGAGNDTIDGLGGFDQAFYSNAVGTVSGISVNMAAGTVVGDVSIGTDTLQSIESVRGTNFADTYDATGFGQAGALNIGNNGTFNEFEGLAGNDTIIGNGNTRITFVNATGGVIVDVAAGTVTGDASVGTDTFTGVSQVRGSQFADTLSGDANNNTLDGQNGDDVFDGRDGNDTLTGGGGNDTLTGGSGIDRATYTDATGPITVNMAAASNNVTGAGVGSDTLSSVESIRGSAFADTYVATGYNGASAIGSTPASFNEFEGMAGNDIITGNGNTRLSYLNATGAVTVDIAASTVTGDSSVGTDTFSGVNFVRGSAFADTLLGSNNSGQPEVFEGGGGNDFINGRGGTDRVIYEWRTDVTVTGGITVNLAAGTVVGDASVGSDTLRSIEMVRGTRFADSYNAVGFTASSTNAGSAGVDNTGAAFNEFEGLGGNDSITGNGNTRISYVNATAGVTVDFAAGTATGDASVGTDTFSGVNAVVSSAFADTITGDSLNNAYVATVDNVSDTFDGGAGFDTANYSAYSAALTVTLNGNAQVTVQGSGSDDAHSDKIANVENFVGGTGVDTVAGDGFNNTYFASVDNVVDVFNGGAGFDTANYSAYSAALSVTLNGSAQVIVHGSGSDDAHSDMIANVENVVGGSGNDFFVGDTNNNTFTGGAGTDQISYFSAVGPVTINLAAGTVVGDGTDTLRSIEYVVGTAAADSYDANGFSGSSVNAGSNGTFNIFVGAGGNDTITGNGNTQVQYFNATSGVSITLGANGSGSASGSSSGTDTFISGVNNVLGSNFNDTYDASAFLNGSFNQFQGIGGDDTITGNGSTQLYYAGASEAIAATLNNGGSGTVVGGPSVGTDTILSGVNNVIGSNFADTFTLNSPGSTFQSFLTGNGGDDTFVFKTNSGHTTITDFHANTGGQADIIDLAAFGLLQSDLQTLINSAAGDTIQIDANTSISLTGVDVHQLHVTDFHI